MAVMHCEFECTVVFHVGLLLSMLGVKWWYALYYYYFNSNRNTQTNNNHINNQTAAAMLHGEEMVEPCVGIMVEG
jgi:hypothetical protein